MKRVYGGLQILLILGFTWYGSYFLPKFCNFQPEVVWNRGFWDPILYYLIFPFFLFNLMDQHYYGLLFFIKKKSKKSYLLTPNYSNKSVRKHWIWSAWTSSCGCNSYCDLGTSVYHNYCRDLMNHCEFNPPGLQQKCLRIQLFMNNCFGWCSINMP